jgi:hypothetical protein
MSFVCERSIRSARKLHHCWYCGDAIPLRTSYEQRVTFSEDEGFGRMRFHSACETFAVEVLGYSESEYRDHNPDSFRKKLTHTSESRFTVIMGGQS